MNTFSKILRIVFDLFSSTPKKQSGSATRPGPQARPGRPGPTGGSGELSPGQSGKNATTEIDATRQKNVRLDYSPQRDGDADPGEVVWTWVPYEENDGRGKDRPVLVVARLEGSDVLAVMLTSKQHPGGDYLPLGSGEWDSQGRPSWAVIDRVFRVHAGGMRREASQLDRRSFETVAQALRQRYGWR